MLLPILLAAGSAAQAQEDGQWTMPAKNYASTRYSGLAEITAGNAGGLRPVWTFSTGVLAGHEGQPLVVRNTMYVATPYPNVLYAFDLTQEGYPLKWKYRPDVSPNAVGISCCDVVNRGAFYADGKVVYNLLDGHTVAVDAATGKELWKTTIADLSQGETTPMAPFVVKDRVIVGASGGEFGIYGWVKALDLKTGRMVWTARNIGPDSAVLAKPGTFKPHYDKGTELGVTSWPENGWKTGGAPVWGWMSYDPALDLLYHGVGNPSPYNAEQRPGDNKWTASVLARRPADGSLVWAYQFTPHDNWDYDATSEMILADLTIGGRPRKVLVNFNKNGFAYTLDRATGEVLVAEPFADENWAKKIDLTTGRPVLDSTKLTGASKGNTKDICPSLEGGKSPASPAAYSPRTRLFYTSTNNMCMDFQPIAVAHVSPTPFIGVTSPYRAGPGGHMGAFIAWDAATGKKAWETREPYPAWSGAVVTAGDVVFYGTLDGWFKAADAKTGKVLWKFKVGSGVVGNPIVRAALPVLVLAVAACRRGGRPAQQPNQQAQQGAPPAVRYDEYIAAGGRQPPGAKVSNPHKGDKKAVDAGGGLFVSMNCDGCHGGGATGWVGPSLADGRWRYGGADDEIFQSIFYGRPHGMPAFGGVLPADAIWMLVTYPQSLPAPATVPTQSWEKP